jgi:hypothetical protein
MFTKSLDNIFNILFPLAIIFLTLSLYVSTLAPAQPRQVQAMSAHQTQR